MTVLVAVALASTLTAYTRSEVRLCAACGARTERSERGFALSPDLRLALYVSDQVEPIPNVARFLPPDHVHDRDCSMRFSQDGPLLSSAFSCRGRQPGNFARRLAGTPGFADFVASQIDAGKVDAATVRALVAVPARGSLDAEDPAVVLRGEDLAAEFSRAAPAGPARIPGEPR